LNDSSQSSFISRRSISLSFYIYNQSSIKCHYLSCCSFNLHKNISQIVPRCDTALWGARKVFNGQRYVIGSSEFNLWKIATVAVFYIAL
jgi:hypothetical protein